MSLTRQNSFTRAQPDAGSAEDPGSDITVDMAFATDTPYERWWGIEILDCRPESVRLGRLNDGGPLLFNHNWDELRGHLNSRPWIAARRLAGGCIPGPMTKS